jgi:hypothetical protein
MLADDDTDDDELAGDDDSCKTSPSWNPTDPGSTFYHAQAAATAGARDGEDDDDVCFLVGPVPEAGATHADPFAWAGASNKTTAVSLEQRCMVKLLKLLEDTMNCPD